MQVSDYLRADIDHEFEQFRLGDAGSLTEIWLRRFFVGAVGGLLWIATEQTVVLLWSIGFILIDVVYTGFLRSQSAPIALRHLIAAMIGSILIGFCFGGMVIYVSAIGDGQYVLLAASGCVGIGLHCISRNYYFSYSGMIQVTTAVLTGIGLLIEVCLHIEPMISAVVTFVGGLGVVSYFVVCFRKIIQERQDFHRRLQAEKQDDKMRALGQFTSGVAHDFNNLLTVVNGNIELAKMDPEGIEAHKYLEEAHAAGLKGAVLIQQLLAFARKSKIVVSDIDLSGLFSRIEGILRRVLPAHVTLSVRQNNEPIQVRGDVAMLENAIINLVINARDALGEKRGDITISIKSFGTEEVEIDVSDTGPGMDKETLARAVEPFFTTKAVGEGSGLGLSMVNGVVAQCGGRFVLQNRLGGGLSARIYLPVANTETVRRIPLEDTVGSV